MLVGQYDYAIDAKGRLNFPAKFRDAMGETFIVTRWLDHCLAAFPSDEFEKVASMAAVKSSSLDSWLPFQAAVFQISAKLRLPMTVTSWSRPAYSRRRAGNWMRPCLSGVTSTAEE